jgi:pimeloyl-ACP methyl ester carboxylesterase
MPARVDVEHRFVATNGVRLHCAIAGRGPLVVLLHGFPESWYSWRHQIAALAPHFRVVAPDLRGYNESEKPHAVSAYTLAEVTADVVGLIEALGEREAVIVGHDWGGAVAWTLATDQPAVVRRLVVLNCPHPAIFIRHLRENPRQLARSFYMLVFQIPWLPERVLAARRAWLVGRGVRRTAVRRDFLTQEALDTLRDNASRPGGLHGGLNYYRAIFRSPDAQAATPEWLRRFLHGDRPLAGVRRDVEDWPKITAPTLLVWGENDFALGRELTLGMEPLFAGPFQIKYIPLCGHWVQQEQPELVNGYLLDFLADLAPGARAEPVALPGTDAEAGGLEP